MRGSSDVFYTARLNSAFVMKPFCALECISGAHGCIFSADIVAKEAAAGRNSFGFFTSCNLDLRNIS